ncbi:unnamed protein product [Fusarium graminearum]|nr:unnamed protein product [Fusarium graminearum]VTO92808.1 unnamed protein product [Fusarium graminearum]
MALIAAFGLSLRQVPQLYRVLIAESTQAFMLNPDFLCLEYPACIGGYLQPADAFVGFLKMFL